MHSTSGQAACTPCLQASLLEVGAAYVHVLRPSPVATQALLHLRKCMHHWRLQHPWHPQHPKPTKPTMRGGSHKICLLCQVLQQCSKCCSATRHKLTQLLLRTTRSRDGQWQAMLIRQTLAQHMCLTKEQLSKGCSMRAMAGKGKSAAHRHAAGAGSQNAVCDPHLVHHQLCPASRRCSILSLKAWMMAPAGLSHDAHALRWTALADMKAHCLRQPAAASPAVITKASSCRSHTW